MLEKFKNNKKDSDPGQPSDDFDEGKDMDTGEIDPASGERIFYRDVSSESMHGGEGKKNDVQKGGLKTNEMLKGGRCGHCGGLTCTADCEYR